MSGQGKSAARPDGERAGGRERSERGERRGGRERDERRGGRRLRVGIDARQLWELGIGTYVRNLLGGLARVAESEIDLNILLPPPPWRDDWVDPVAAAAGYPGARGESGGEGLGRAGEGGAGEGGMVPAILPAGGKRGPETLISRAGKHSLLQQFIVPAQVLGRGIEVFHAPHYVCALGVPCPLVVTVHDLIHLLFPEFLPPARRQAARLLLRAAVGRAARVIVDSERTAQDLAEFFPHCRKKLRAIYPGLAVSYLNRPAPDAIETFRRARGLPARYFLAVGALRPHKNLATLARAFAASGLAPGVGLVLAGEAPARFRDLPPVLAAEAGPGTLLLGRVREADLPLLYAGATAVTVPSLYEGFGFAATEAMALGIPVLASTGGSLPEVVSDAGILLAPEDVGAWRQALVRIASDGGLRDELAARGRARAAHFSLERLASETLAVYREAAG